MGKIYDDLTKTVGNTPLVRLNTVTKGLEATVGYSNSVGALRALQIFDEEL